MLPESERQRSEGYWDVADGLRQEKVPTESKYGNFSHCSVEEWVKETMFRDSLLSQ
jgi:hypothetical protein